MQFFSLILQLQSLNTVAGVIPPWSPALKGQSAELWQLGEMLAAAFPPQI